MGRLHGLRWGTYQDLRGRYGGCTRSFFAVQRVWFGAGLGGLTQHVGNMYCFALYTFVGRYCSTIIGTDRTKVRGYKVIGVHYFYGHRVPNAIGLGDGGLTTTTLIGNFTLLFTYTHKTKGRGMVLTTFYTLGYTRRTNKEGLHFHGGRVTPGVFHTHGLYIYVTSSITIISRGATWVTI